MRTIIIFRNGDDRDFDKYILAPEGMGIHEASVAAEECAQGVKATIEDWTWDDIEEALEALGFEYAAWVHAETEV